MLRLLFVLLFILLFGCSKEKNDANPDQQTTDYFPPIGENTWEKVTPENLEWDAAALEELFEFLSENKTRAFVVLKNGRIVVEQYWGKNIFNSTTFDQNTLWYWASAGKTITSFLIGQAQYEDLIDINNKTSDYLGEHWTALPLDKEALITVKHQLTMTTGLDYGVVNPDCTEAECLQYKTDAGNQWFYHNAPYTLLDKVISTTSGISFNQFTDERLERKIGMNGNWIASGSNNVYWSTARDAARFGLLILNGCKWNSEPILNDPDYVEDMITSSQDINPSYGYLWWLNGKNKIIYPGLPTAFNTSLAPGAPAVLFAAIGKNGQFIDIVPSEDLVVIRMGEAPDDALVPVTFHDELWVKMDAVIH